MQQLLTGNYAKRRFAEQCMPGRLSCGCPHKMFISEQPLSDSVQKQEAQFFSLLIIKQLVLWHAVWHSIREQ